MKFDIDQNGILHVSARDLGSGKEASVRIEQSSGLSKTEIERMQKDAEEHAEEDRRQFELAEARNKAHHLIYQLEKQMKENADKLTDNDRGPLNSASKNCERRQMEVATSTRSETRPANWSRQPRPLAKSFMKRRARRNPEQVPPRVCAPGGGDDDAIDAEFEVKDK